MRNVQTFLSHSFTLPVTKVMYFFLMDVTFVSSIHFTLFQSSFLPSFSIQSWSSVFSGSHQPYSPLNFAVCKLCTCFINSPSPNNPVKAALLRSHFMGDHVQKDKSLALGHIVQSVLELDLNTGCLS